MRTSQKAVQALFGLAVAGALVFGATEAPASAREACYLDPANGDIGYCADQAACESRCLDVYGPGVTGACNAHCCSCV